MTGYEGRHEKRDVPAQVPAYIVVFAAVIIPLGALIAWLLATTVWDAPQAPPPIFADAPAPPEPQLQRSPPDDMAHMDASQNQRLRSAGWIDRQAGVVHLPIDRAMDLLVERGLPAPAPDWQPQPEPTPPSQPPQGQGGSR